MSALPQPRFAVGQTVYAWRVERSREAVPCPDCLGSKRWKAITPTGGEFVVDCQRCATFTSELPRLERVTHVPRVDRLTIGSVRIDSADARPVSYMCVETGVGSGTVWYESSLCADEDEAARLALGAATAANADANEKPAAKENAQLHLLTFREATLTAARRQVITAWGAHNDLVENLNRLIEGGDTISRDDLVGLVDDYERYLTPDPFERLMRAVEAQIAGDGSIDELRAAWRGIPGVLAVPAEVAGA